MPDCRFQDDALTSMDIWRAPNSLEMRVRTGETGAINRGDGRCKSESNCWTKAVGVSWCLGLRVRLHRLHVG